MTDSEYLAETVAACKRMDELIATFYLEIKDIDGTLLYRSSLFKDVAGAERDSATTNWLPPDVGSYTRASSIREELSVATNQVVKHTLVVNYLDNILQPYMTSKYPIINHKTGNSVGVLVIIQQLLFSSLQYLLLRGINDIREPKPVDYEKYRLTKREKQLIFLFMSGMGSREIAFVLSKLEHKTIAKKTIDNIFGNQLLLKFDVFSREALYDKLLKLGFDQLIPLELLVGIKLPLRLIKTY